MELALSRGRLDIISNLLRSEKRKNTSREESSINDLFSKKKTSRKELQIAKFNLSDPMEDEQETSKVHYLYS
jgi:hypothetical protein